MVLVGTQSLAHATRHRRVLPNGFSFHRSEWMDGGRNPVLSPTVFLVEQPPHAVLATHFHGQNQFQVVQHGSGTLGPHAIGPGSVHYAGAYTGYGPLVAGAQGLSYFTIRASYESGASFLPADRDKLQRGPKRHAQGPTHPPSTRGRLLGLSQPVRTVLIPPGDDGLEAFAWELPPHAGVVLPEPTGSGQFQLVLAGQFVTPQRRLLEWESRYASPHAQAGETRAGAAGLHLLVRQMRERDAHYALG